MNQRMAWMVCSLAALAVYACSEDETGSSGPTSTTTTNATSTSTASQGGATSSTASQTATASTGMGGGMGVGGGGDCPEDPNDDPCTACMKMSCCQQSLDCLADTECSTCLACLQTEPEPATCFQNGDCDFQDAETQAVLQCAQGSCGQQCM